MRGTLWLLAVMGVASAAWAADDYYGTNRSSVDARPRSARIEYFSKSGQTGVQQTTPQRYTRSSAVGQQPTKLKNYHRELFGTDKPARRPVQDGVAITPQPTNSAFSEPAAIRQVGAETTGTGKRYKMTLDRAQFPADEQPSAIRHANFESKTANPQTESIQQISGTGPAISGASPFRDPAELQQPAPTAPSLETPIAPASQEEIEAAIEKSSRRPRITMQAPRRRTANEGFATATVATADTPVVSMEWIKKSDINVGQECECDLVIKNKGTVAAADVIVEAYFPASVRLTSASPEPQQAKDRLSWTIDMLPAGEEKTISLSLIPTQRGELATSATVRFTGVSLANFTVEEPLLTVALEGPQEVKVGESAAHVVKLANPGTGVCKDVAIEVHLPAGLEHSRGGRLLMEVGSLNPGEEKNVRLSLTATSGGPQTLQVRATGASDLEQVASAQVNVIAPSLQLAVNGPALRYLKRAARYTVSVSNDGEAATNNVRVVHKVPKGFEYIGSDKGGKFDFDARTVSWFVGRVGAQETIELKVHLQPIELGAFVHEARATSEHGALASANLETQIEGTASLVLEIVDLDDPVEVDAETAYEIRIRNNGSKSAERVGLSCELPGGVEFLDANGPSQHISESGLIVFKAIDELAPGKTAVYRVHVRGTIDGNHRFRARLTSDSILEPLVFEELTKFYAD